MNRSIRLTFLAKKKVSDLRLMILTIVMMFRNAVNRRGMIWLCSLFLISLLLITPEIRIPGQLVSLSILLPAVFLLPGWADSTTRKGIMGITSRGDGGKLIRIAEWIFPALAGVVISSITVFAFQSAPKWQFWVVSLLVSISFSLILITTEKYWTNAGRAVLSLMWLVQTTGDGPTDSISGLLLFTGYPAEVLTTDQVTASCHPDTYVLASMILLFLAAGGHTLLLRRKN